MKQQWPRALLRAALLEAGYDAVGARSLHEALSLSGPDPDRGPVRLVLVDDSVLRDEDAKNLPELFGRHEGAISVLLAPATGATPERSWHRILRRPLSIGEIVREIQALMPLADSASGSV